MNFSPVILVELFLVGGVAIGFALWDLRMMERDRRRAARRREVQPPPGGAAPDASCAPGSPTGDGTGTDMVGDNDVDADDDDTNDTDDDTGDDQARP